MHDQNLSVLRKSCLRVSVLGKVGASHIENNNIVGYIEARTIVTVYVRPPPTPSSPSPSSRLHLPNGKSESIAISVRLSIWVDGLTISSPLPRAELPNNIGSEWLTAISSCTRRAQMPSQCQSPGSRACGLPRFRSPGPAPPRRCAFHACHAPGFPAASDGKESRTSASSKVDRI